MNQLRIRSYGLAAFVSSSSKEGLAPFKKLFTETSVKFFRRGGQKKKKERFPAPGRVWAVEIPVPLYKKIGELETKVFTGLPGILHSIEGIEKTYKGSKNVTLEYMHEIPKVFPDAVVPARLDLLRDYQEEAFKAVMSKNYGIVRLPTGSGKTEILLACALAFVKKGYKVMIVCPTTAGESEIYHRALDYEIKAKRFRDSRRIGGVTVSTPRVIVNQGKTVIREAKKLKTVMIVDECHHIKAETWQELFQMIRPRKVFGFSATPFETSDESSEGVVRSYLGKIIYSENSSSPRIAVHLSDPTLISYEWQPKKLPMGAEAIANSSDWQSVRTLVHIKSRLDLLAEIALFLESKGLRILIPVSVKKYGLKLMDRIPNSIAWFGGGVVHGLDTDYDYNGLKQKIEKGKIRTVICTSHLDESVNIPSLDAIILAEGKVERATLQRAGRVIRKCGDKPTFLINVGFDGVKILHKHSEARKAVLKFEYEKPMKIVHSMNALEAVIEKITMQAAKGEKR